MFYIYQKSSYLDLGFLFVLLDVRWSSSCLNWTESLLPLHRCFFATSFNYQSWNCFIRLCTRTLFPVQRIAFPSCSLLDPLVWAPLFFFCFLCISFYIFYVLFQNDERLNSLPWKDWFDFSCKAAGSPILPCSFIYNSCLVRWSLCALILAIQTLYIYLSKGGEDSWLLFESMRGLWAEKFGQCQCNEIWRITYAFVLWYV